MHSRPEREAPDASPLPSNETATSEPLAAGVVPEAGAALSHPRSDGEEQLVAASTIVHDRSWPSTSAPFPTVKVAAPLPPGETDCERLSGVAVAVGEQSGWVSNAWVPSVRLEGDPWLALKPRPRLEKPRQIRHWFSPPVRATSAARIPSRASTKPGLHGWSFIPSTTSWMARLLPPVSQAS